MARFHGLVTIGKNCYYRLLERKSMDWRMLLMAMAVRFHAILRKEKLATTEGLRCFILDDTTIEKSGILAAIRLSELDEDKISMGIEMVKRATGH